MRMSVPRQWFKVLRWRYSYGEAFGSANLSMPISEAWLLRMALIRSFATAGFTCCGIKG